MTQTYFRIQSAAHDPLHLLDPGYQFSHPVNGSAVRRGVSVCDSIEDLALYLASPQGAGVLVRVARDATVIVELEGDESGDAPLDPEMESLIIPTRIIGVTPVGEEFVTLVEESRMFLAAFTDPNLDD